MYIGNHTLLNPYNVSCPTLPQLVEIPTSPTLTDGGEGGLLWLLHVHVCNTRQYSNVSVYTGIAYSLPLMNTTVPIFVLLLVVSVPMELISAC